MCDSRKSLADVFHAFSRERDISIRVCDILFVTILFVTRVFSRTSRRHNVERKLRDLRQGNKIAYKFLSHKKKTRAVAER